MKTLNHSYSKDKIKDSSSSLKKSLLKKSLIYSSIFASAFAYNSDVDNTVFKSTSNEPLITNKQVVIKGGTYGHSIIRGSLLQSLVESENNILHFNMALMSRIGFANELNVGFGYRHHVESYNSIFGGFANLDYRRQNKQNFYQITVGAEWFTENVDIRFNGYYPLNNKDVVIETTDEIKFEVEQGASDKRKNLNQYKVSRNILRIKEEESNSRLRALAGFDMSAEFVIPQIQRMSFQVGYYYFGKRNGNKEENINMNGLFGKVDFKLNDSANLLLELSGDNETGKRFYTGLSIGSSKKHQSGSKLKSKFYTLPKRDIDVIINKVTDTKDLFNATVDNVKLDDVVAVYNKDTDETNYFWANTKGDLVPLSKEEGESALKNKDVITDQSVVALVIDNKHLKNVNEDNQDDRTAYVLGYNVLNNTTSDDRKLFTKSTNSQTNYDAPTIITSTQSAVSSKSVSKQSLTLKEYLATNAPKSSPIIKTEASKDKEIIKKATAVISKAQSLVAKKPNETFADGNVQRNEIESVDGNVQGKEIESVQNVSAPTQLIITKKVDSEVEETKYNSFQAQVKKIEAAKDIEINLAEENVNILDEAKKHFENLLKEAQNMYEATKSKASPLIEEKKKELEDLLKQYKSLGIIKRFTSSSQEIVDMRKEIKSVENVIAGLEANIQEVLEEVSKRKDEFDKTISEWEKAATEKAKAVAAKIMFNLFFKDIDSLDGFDGDTDLSQAINKQGGTLASFKKQVESGKYLNEQLGKFEHNVQGLLNIVDGEAAVEFVINTLKETNNLEDFKDIITSLSVEKQKELFGKNLKVAKDFVNGIGKYTTKTKEIIASTLRVLLTSFGNTDSKDAGTLPSLADGGVEESKEYEPK